MLSVKYVGTFKSLIQSFKGLVTNLNELDTDAGAMLVAKNIILSRQNIIEPRHAVSKVTLNSGTQPCYKQTDNFQFVSMYAWTVPGFTSFVLPMSGSASGANNIGQVTGTDSQDISTYTYTQSNIGSDVPSFTTTTTPDYLVPRFAESKEQLFVSANNGVWKSRSDTTNNLGNGFVKSAIPFPGKLVASLYSSATDAQKWFTQGNEVAFVFLVRRKVNSQQSIEGRVSPTYKLQNTVSLRTGVQVTVTPGRFAQAGDIIEVYRSVQYAISTATPPVNQFRLCAKMTCPAAYTATSAFTLIGNDGALNLPGVTYVPTENGSDNIPIPVGAQMPLCRDMANFQGYTWFANVTRPVIASCQLLRSPADGETISFATDSSGTSSVTLRFKTTPSASLDVQIARNYPTSALNPSDYYRTGNSVVAGQTDVDILSNDGTTNTLIVKVHPTDTPRYGVYTAGTWTANDLTVTPTAGSFDRGQFPKTNGTILIEDGTANAKAQTIFTYEQLDTSSSSTVKFLRCSGVGLALSSVPATGNLYSLPGAAISTLPVYVGDGSSYYSFLPVKTQLQTEIGVPANYDMASFTYSGGQLLLNVQFLVVAKKLESELIAQSIVNLCRTINADSTATRPFYFEGVPGNPLGFTVEGYTSDTSQVYAQSSVTSLLAPTVTTSTWTLISDDYKAKNGLMYSKIGRTEAIARISAVRPEFIGDTVHRILRIAGTSNDLFVFKELEGIYRVNVQPGADLPVIQSSVLLDNTTYLVASESVQVIDESIFFLAQKGFFRVNSTSLVKLSNNIEDSLKRLIAKVDLTQVRSFGNEYRKLYCCYFPTVNADNTGTCLVYDTVQDEWYEWPDISFDSAVVTLANKLTLLTRDFNFSTPVPTTTTGINSLALDPTKPYTWQYLRQEQFTGELQDDIVDLNFNSVTTQTAEPTFHVSSGVNDPQAPVDQVELRLSGFSSVTGTFPTLTYTKTGVTQSGPYDDFLDVPAFVRGKQLYAYTRVNGASSLSMTPVSIAAISGLSGGSTSISVTFPSNIRSATPDPTTDQILIGVNVEMQFRQFDGGAAHLLKKFAKATFTVQDYTPTYMTMAFKVDTSHSYSEDTVFSTVVTDQTAYDCFIPIEATLGRYLRVRIKHSTPKERFAINGLGVAFSGNESMAISKG